MAAAPVATQAIPSGMWIPTITPTKIGSVEGISIPKMTVVSPAMREVLGSAMLFRLRFPVSDTFHEGPIWVIIVPVLRPSCAQARGGRMHHQQPSFGATPSAAVLSLCQRRTRPQ
jgi:hypothetical protein